MKYIAVVLLALIGLVEFILRALIFIALLVVLVAPICVPLFVAFEYYDHRNTLDNTIEMLLYPVSFKAMIGLIDEH